MGKLHSQLAEVQYNRQTAIAVTVLKVSPYGKQLLNWESVIHIRQLVFELPNERVVAHIGNG